MGSSPGRRAGAWSGRLSGDNDAGWFSGLCPFTSPPCPGRTAAATAWESTSSSPPVDGSVRDFTGTDSSLGEAEHVGALGVLGATAAFLGRELVVWVDLTFEPLEEVLAGWPDAGGSVAGAAPRDLSRDPLVDVLGCYGTLPPRMLRGVITSAFVSASVLVRLRAYTRVRQPMRQFVRQLLTVRLLGQGDCDGAAEPGDGIGVAHRVLRVVGVIDVPMDRPGNDCGCCDCCG